MAERIAFFNDRFVPESQAVLALDDWGLLQGAMVIERLRTCNLKVLDLEAHLRRLRSSCEMIGIVQPDGWRLADLVQQCVDLNINARAKRDFSIVVLVTPGRQSDGERGEHPSLIIHSAGLDWVALNHWYVNGQPLIVAQQRAVPAACWSPQLKTRSRMHFYLADQQAAASPLEHVGALLLSIDHCVTETSIANIIVVDGKQRLISPPEETVLHGISLRRTLGLAKKAGFSIDFQPMSVQKAGLASEILLTGSSGCIWPASRLGDIAFQDAAERPVYRTLQDLWRNDIGLDFVKQASTYAAQALNPVP